MKKIRQNFNTTRKPLIGTDGRVKSQNAFGAWEVTDLDTGEVEWYASEWSFELQCAQLKKGSEQSWIECRLLAPRTPNAVDKYAVRGEICALRQTPYWAHPDGSAVNAALFQIVIIKSGKYYAARPTRLRPC